MILDHGELLTWALDEFPRIDQQISAVRLPNHRIAYLEYEGDVSGDRGVVKRVEAGRCVIHEQSVSHCFAELHGKSLQAGMEIALAGEAGPEKAGLEDAGLVETAAPNRDTSCAKEPQRCIVSISSVGDFLERRSTNP